MKEIKDRRREASFGTLAVEQDGPVTFRPSASSGPVRAASVRYLWRPPRGMRNQVPGGFALPLRCVVGPDGLRRIFPYYSPEGFITLASTGGLAVLCQRQRLGKHARHSYRAMWLLFLKARRMREFFGQSFASCRDLYVSPGGRTDPSERDVLPETLGLDARGRGHRWSVSELTARGAEAARLAGLARPNAGQRIRYGLLEAAKRDPLTVPAAKVPQLVRSALFHVSPSTGDLDPGLVDAVAERILEALDTHLEDDAENFDKWFQGRHNSLVHQVAKKKHGRGGQLDEEDVREAILELGWRAYRYVGDCVNAQMRTVENAMPEPLRGAERELYEHMHLAQPYLGGLPLVLLAERLGFIQEAVWEVWQDLADPGRLPVLYRVLDYYAVMAAKRRDADRTLKGGRARDFKETIHSPEKGLAVFQELAGHLREKHGISCACARPDWGAELEGRAGPAVTIRYGCARCERVEKLKVSERALREAATALL